MSETWVWNESVEVTNANYTISFISNGKVFNTIYFIYDIRPSIKYDSVLVATGREMAVGTWVDQAYRTVTFSTPPTGDLLTVLQANATKQSTGGVLA